jgi:hypothetical protein
MSEEQILKPPYLSYTTFKNFLGSLKNGVIPARIDKTLMVGQSGATQSYLMAALRFFKLIDATGAPEPELKTLITSEGEERKDVWKERFETGYKPVIGDLNLETATVGMLHEKFSALSLASDTVKKCHSFFAAAAEDAGVALAPQLKPNTRGASTGRRSGKKKTPKPGFAAPADEFAGEDEGNGNGGAEPTQVATLLLDREGKRTVKLRAPATITTAELERIQKWLSFQLIVEAPE